MEDKNNISIFQGSAVEADTVHDFLAQHEIGALVRNHMQENLDAGWVTAAPDYAAEVFVAKNDEERAVDLLRNLFHSEIPSRPAQASGNAVVVNSPTTRPAASEGRTTPPAAPKPPIV